MAARDVVIAGLDASVVTLALAADIDAIAAETGKMPKDSQKRLANNSSPYRSTIVFLVRKGNPKQIKDWDDLVKSGVQVVTPNPKTSGAARWDYLAALAFAAAKNKGDEDKTRAFMADLFKNVSLLDTGARGATTTFARRGIGDVLIAWENEAASRVAGARRRRFEIVVPSRSIRAEPTVALVDRNVGTGGKRKAATAYLEFLYAPPVQAAIAKALLPAGPAAIRRRVGSRRAAATKLATIDGGSGGWAAAQKRHFADGDVRKDLRRCCASSTSRPGIRPCSSRMTRRRR